MGNHHLDAVFANRTLVAGERLVMIVLANRANGDDTCWPAVQRIATEAGLGVRQVQRILRKLTDNGYLEQLTTGHGRGNTAHYRILLKGDAIMSPFAEEEKVTSDALKGDITAQKVTSDALKGDITSHAHVEPNEPTIEPKERERARAAESTVAKAKSRKQTPAVVVWDPRKVGEDGYVAGGIGETPVEVYYEFVRPKDWVLSKPVREQLLEEIEDLERWRWTLKQCSLRGFQVNNIADRLKCYHNGFRDGLTYENRHSPPTHNNTNGRTQNGSYRRRAEERGDVAKQAERAPAFDEYTPEQIEQIRALRRVQPRVPVNAGAFPPA